MENMRKRMLFLLASIMCVMTSCWAGKPIAYNEMSQEARNFIEQTFPDAKVVFVESYFGIFGSSYEVSFNTGDEIKVTNTGEWKEISCEFMTFPESLLPDYIKTYLDSNFPNVKIEKIEKYKKYVEVELANNIEIKFNYEGKVIEFDN